MALGILYDKDMQKAAFFDTVTGTAFGEVFEGHDAREQAVHFAVCWIGARDADARQFSTKELSELRAVWAMDWLDEDGDLIPEGHEQVEMTP